MLTIVLMRLMLQSHLSHLEPLLSPLLLPLLSPLLLPLLSPLLLPPLPPLFSPLLPPLPPLLPPSQATFYVAMPQPLLELKCQAIPASRTNAPHPFIVHRAALQCAAVHCTELHCSVLPHLSSVLEVKHFVNLTSGIEAVTPLVKHCLVPLAEEPRNSQEVVGSMQQSVVSGSTW